MEANSEAYSEPYQTLKMEVFAKVVSDFNFWIFLQKASSQITGKILSSPLKPVATCWKSSISDAWQSFEFAFVAIDYFRKSVGYLFTKFYSHIPPYIKQYSIVHGKIHVTFCLTYLLILVSLPFVSMDYG